MKLLSSSHSSYKNQKKQGSHKISSIQFAQNSCLGIVSRPNFCGDAFIQKTGKKLTHSAYLSAKKYLNQGKKSGDYWQDLDSFNPDKLEGIQKGIKVFEGFSVKQIKFLLENLTVIMVNRGCSNRCSHCAANAIPQHFAKGSDMIKSMPWEDYNLLMKGIGKLNSRLGFNSLNGNDYGSISLFHDADCMELEMKDKRGKIHDFADASNLLLSSTKKLSLFDTSGWYPKSEKMQRRAEKIVNYLANNNQKFDQINISVNPFHVLLEKSNEYLLSNRLDEAKKFREIYTDRIANAIFTFTPLVDKANFHFLIRTKSNDKLHSDEFLLDLENEILQKLESLYVNDFKNSQKIIKNEDQISKKMESVNEKLRKKGSEIAKLGRAEKFFTDKMDTSYLSALNDERIFLYDLKEGIVETSIDANGKIYATNSYLMVPTRFALNISNKGKQTIPPGKAIDDANVKVVNNIIDKFIIK